ncbi:hypothetical protein MTR_1g084710 [Medicago truncatula]|uniref:Uncharacterized protein n=1 Tax=Medicago truncatula TaxID=3880 RepID=G7I9J3_MEDTR|nr:hypothetical protein MTR_1g084710 [Medicago truncatula]
MSGFAAKVPSNFWFVDRGCTIHITYMIETFSKSSKKVYIPIEGIGTVEIESHSVLLSVAHSLEEGYEVLFKRNNCLIKDQNDKVIKIGMKFRKFIFDSMNIKYTLHEDEKKNGSESKEDHADIGVSKKFPVKRKNEDVSEEPPSFITKLKNNITAIKKAMFIPWSTSY